MADHFLNGYEILSGDAMEGLSGVWTADITCASPQGTFKKGDSVSMSLAGKTRVGTIVNVGDPELRSVIRVIGGKGRISDPTVTLEPRDYKDFTLDRVVADVLRDAGEIPGDLSALATVPLAHWIRARTTPNLALKRLMRVAPDDVVLRADPDGSIRALRLTWPSYGPDLGTSRVAEWSAEDAMAVFVEDGNYSPGVTVPVRGVQRRVARVQYLLESEFRTVLWFDGGSGGGDPMRDALEKITMETMAEYPDPDYRALYEARVVKVGSGTVDVVFEDVSTRLRFKSGILIAPEVGDSVEWQRGTRVLVGWRYADERFPYVIPAWTGGGGLVSVTRKFSGALTYDGPSNVFRGNPLPGAPLVKVQGDEQVEHDLSGGLPPVAITTNGSLTINSVSGGDRMFQVEFTTSSNLPPLSPLFQVTFARPYLPSTKVMVMGLLSDHGSALKVTPLIPGVSFLSFFGAVASALPSGNHVATFRTGV